MKDGDAECEMNGDTNKWASGSYSFMNERVVYDAAVYEAVYEEGVSEREMHINERAVLVIEQAVPMNE